MENGKSQNRVWKTPPLFWVLLATIVVLGGIAFQYTIADMVHRWNTQEEYGYAYLIPVISLFLVWQRKNRLAEIEFRPSWTGLLLIVFGGFLFFLGEVATTFTLSQYGLVVTILGIALALLGREAFRVVMVPLALLFFMVPLPPFIYNTLSTRLQLISSGLGVAVIRLFDISVYLEGNVIDLGTYKLQVVDACSGLRYLFPLASLSFVAAYIYIGDFWKKAVIFLSSIPITVLMNSFRIGVIGILVEYGGQGQAEGFLHYFEGWVIFMACIALLILEMALLARVGRNRLSLATAFAIELPGALPKELERRSRRVAPFAWSVAVLVALLVGVGSFVHGKHNTIPQRRVFAEFPLSIAGWEGTTGKLEENILESLKTEDYIISDYRNSTGAVVNFYVAYYADQAAGSAAHSPRACIPGGGWLIKNLSEHVVDGVKFNGKPLVVNRLVIRKDDLTQVVYYWFQQRGRDITNEWMVKWYLFWDAMTKNRTDGALVRLVTPVSIDESVQDGDKRLTAFARAVYPYLSNYIPD
jgi:exosortase D (VPLPA-CTERM-specific)